MADILTTKEIAVALDNIIKRAEKYICLFTFNIKIDETYMSRLRNAAKRGIRIIVVFGVDNGNPEILNTLLKIPNCKVYFKEYLHAKFFYNEKQLMVGSMNLSETSEKRNYELSVLFDVKDHLDLFKKVKEEAKEIIQDSVEWSDLKKEIAVSNTISHNQKNHIDGSCIRCSKLITYNPYRPLCYDCYTEWSEWENEFYHENYCHRCGKKKDGLCFANPVCGSCSTKM